MSLREVTVLTDIALITCIVQRGVADTIIQAAREAGAQGATVHFARGMGVR
ncbi:MAG: P-II family nitrogen regulator, partial [Nitrospina sp.]|nr:P-II family nitrogen regulator [Nitrospina sp.]